MKPRSLAKLNLFRAGTAFCGAGLFGGCSTPTTTGVKTELSAKALSEISTLGVQVVVLKDFSVVLARERMVNAGFLAGGVTGALIEHGIDVSTDARTAMSLRPRLGDFNCQKAICAALVERLQKTGRFKSVIEVSPNAGSSSQVDGVLTLRIESWGLRTGMGEDSTRRAQSALDAHVLLIHGNGSSRIWERDDYFAGGAVYKVEEFKESQGLLRKEVESAFNRYSDRLANEIRFSK